MPFVEYENLKDRLLGTVVSAFDKDSGLRDTIIRDAEVIIREKTGYAIPESAENAPDWAASIIAAIVNFQMLTVSGGSLSEKTIPVVKLRYEDAIKQLAHYRNTEESASTTGFAACGEFTGGETW